MANTGLLEPSRNVVNEEGKKSKSPFETSQSPAENKGPGPGPPASFSTTGAFMPSAKRVVKEIVPCAKHEVERRNAAESITAVFINRLPDFLNPIRSAKGREHKSIVHPRRPRRLACAVRADPELFGEFAERTRLGCSSRRHGLGIRRFHFHRKHQRGIRMMGMGIASCGACVHDTVSP